MDSYIEKIEEIVRKCGKLILEADRSAIRIDSKSGSANFVTEYDEKVQAILKEELLKAIPEAVFVGEEGEQEKYDGTGLCFIVDPIDGTTNFIKDYHTSCISVGLIKGGKRYIGVVYNPYLDEMFTAKRGEGAYLNGKPIHVSNEPLSNGIVLVGTAPYYQELNEQTFDLMTKYFKASLDIRRSGSAAIDLCSVAAGRAELYFELKISPWDFAAGALIVEEAGGVVTTLDGGEVPVNMPSSVFARNNMVKLLA